MEEQQFELDLDGKPLKIIINNWAEQANGSVLVQSGETVILVTAVISDGEREGIDFFPLTVEYSERYYAAGKIYGSRFIRREGRPSNEAIINARLIDRAIRPLFPQWIKREVQIVITCLSWDGQNDPDVLGLLGASIALGISDIPWKGPLGALRMNQINDELTFNASYKERDEAKLDLILAGVRKDTEILFNMLEGQSQETDEESVVKAAEKALPMLKKIIDFQEKIIKEVGKQKIVIVPPEPDKELEKQIKTFLDPRLKKAFSDKKGKELAEDLSALKKDLLFFVGEKYPGENKAQCALACLDGEISCLVRQDTLENDKRADGRAIDQLREIKTETGVLTRAHGSGLFCRGATKSLSILTLGPPGDQQLFQEMEAAGKKRFMHHYNFPPYSVGEARPMRGPGRREIGHGMLAEKALHSLLPTLEEFPYTIRIVSEILSSNGSSSMASVSSCSLALMDAGVPIKRPATGIAIGLIRDGEKYKLLTDIQGMEDHHGDMDFKVAGTKEGITAIQVDVKIDGITLQMFKESLQKAKKAREEILDKMEKTIAKPREELSPYAPRILTIQINPRKIGEIIGPGGKVINEITEKCGVTIDIEETGKIFVTSESEEAAKKAISWIDGITREVQIGEFFKGKVTRIFAFGAMVEILPNQEGLIHISQLAPHRVKQVEDVVKIGDPVSVKVISIDDQGRINLSLKDGQEASQKSSE